MYTQYINRTATFADPSSRRISTSIGRGLPRTTAEHTNTPALNECIDCDRESPFFLTFNAIRNSMHRIETKGSRERIHTVLWRTENTFGIPYIRSGDVYVFPFVFSSTCSRPFKCAFSSKRHLPLANKFPWARVLRNLFSFAGVLLCFLFSVACALLYACAHTRNNKIEMKRRRRRRCGVWKGRATSGWKIGMLLELRRLTLRVQWFRCCFIFCCCCFCCGLLLRMRFVGQEYFYDKCGCALLRWKYGRMLAMIPASFAYFSLLWKGLWQFVCIFVDSCEQLLRSMDSNGILKLDLIASGLRWKFTFEFPLLTSICLSY